MAQADDRPFGLGLGGWLGVLVVASLGRLAVAALYPVYETEAYYWLWSLYPAAGYFDHPPMIAWLCWLTDIWGAGHSLAPRTHTVLSHFAASLLMFHLGRNLYGSNRVGVLAAVISNLVPFHSIIAVHNQPDSPLLLFWIATVVCFERALRTGRWWWWIVAGGCAGMAFLSKFHGFVFVGFIFFYLLASREDRHWTRTPWPYLAFVVGMVVFVPNIMWNAQNDWLTYRFQFLRHGEETEIRPDYALLTLVAPLLNLSPWFYGLALVLWWRAVRSGAWRTGRPDGMLLWLSGGIFLFFVLMGLRQQIKFHWAAPAFAAACPMLAAAVEAWGTRKRMWFLASGAAVTLAGYAFVLLPPAVTRLAPPTWLAEAPPVVPGERSSRDWFRHAAGWDAIGEAINAEVERLEARAPTFILSRRFDRAAVAAFHARMPRRAWVLDPGEEYSQSSREPDPRAFLAWDNPHVQPGANAVYILFEKDSHRWDRDLRLLGRAFDRVGEVRAFTFEREGRVLRRMYYVACEGYDPTVAIMGPDTTSISATDTPAALAQ